MRVLRFKQDGNLAEFELMRFVSLEQAKRETDGRYYCPPPAHDQTPWCPDEFKSLYRRLRQKGLSALEARPLVEETIERRNVA